MPTDQHQAYIDDFKNYLSAERGLAGNTVAAYMNDVARYLLHLEERSDTSLLTITPEELFTYFSSCKQLEYASASISRYMISLRVFFRFLFREEILDQDLGKYLDTPKIWQLIPEVLSYAEVEALLNQPDQNTKKGIRDIAIIEVLYATGIRVSELCSLDIEAIDDDQIRVTGKGNKTRTVPLGREALLAVDRYLMEARPECEEKGLFLSKFNQRIDRIAVWRIIKEYARQAAIKKTISPHTLRHSFASHLLREGADLRVIQEMLGHNQIASTDRYTHIANPTLYKNFEKYHPRFIKSDEGSS